MDQQKIADVLKPVEPARGLANQHYISDEVFEVEKPKLLFDNWAGIGFAKQVAQTGDAMPVDFIGLPLLVLHRKDSPTWCFHQWVAAQLLDQKLAAE